MTSVKTTLQHQPLHVVHVTETIHGGIGTYLRVLLPYQVERYGAGNVAVIVPIQRAADLEGLVGVRVIGFAEGGGRLMSAWRALAVLLRLLKQQGANVVHLHSTFAGFSCRMGLLFMRRPPRVVYCAHGWAFDRDSRLNPIVRFGERVLSRHTDAIVCISEHDRRSAIAARVQPAKLVVIRNGLPDRLEPTSVPVPTWPESALRLLFVGRLDRQKGLDVLLAALREVQRAVHLHVFGESIVGHGIRQLIPDNVKLHGWADFETIHPYLLSCHALVMPSRWEGLGIAAIEAMRAGKAVISSDVGGLPEVVRNGVTGILVPPGNGAAWAQTLESADVDELVAMGKRGRELYRQQFTLERVDRDLARVYSSSVYPAFLTSLAENRAALPVSSGSKA